MESLKSSVKKRVSKITNRRKKTHLAHPYFSKKRKPTSNQQITFDTEPSFRLQMDNGDPLSSIQPIAIDATKPIAELSELASLGKFSASDGQFPAMKGVLADNQNNVDGKADKEVSTGPLLDISNSLPRKRMFGRLPSASKLQRSSQYSVSTHTLNEEGVVALSHRTTTDTSGRVKDIPETDSQVCLNDVSAIGFNCDVSWEEGEMDAPISNSTLLRPKAKRQSNHLQCAFSEPFNKVKSSAVEKLFPAGELPAHVINPLKSPAHPKQTSTSNLFDKFRRRAGKSRIFSSLRGRNGSKLPTSVSDSVMSEHSTIDSSSMFTGEDYSMADDVPDAADFSDTKTLQSGSNDVFLSCEDVTWTIRDISPARVTTPSPDNQLHNAGVIPPPTPFRVLLTPSDTPPAKASSKTISSDLKKEIELSLLHWPNTVDGEQTTPSRRSSSRSSKTLPKLSSESSPRLSLPGRNAGRPLSWSYDMTEPDSTLAASTSNSQSNHSIQNTEDLTTNQRVPPTSTSSKELDMVPADDSNNTLISEEFGDAVTALRSFSNRKHSYTRDSRRMSQPHPIKLRNRLPSKDSVCSLRAPVVTRTHTRRRSKSEPGRLAHEDIRQNFSKELATSLITRSMYDTGICPAVGDIASLDHRSHRHFKQPSLTIADPLWHHVTNEPEELSFHVGDVILVLDKADKDWWWGRRATSPSYSSDDGVDQQDTGWFPSTFVRLRANQTVTADELLEDIKQGTANTTSVVQQYGSLLSRDQARCNVVNEIMSAEREYVKHLQDIVEGYKGKAIERTEMFSGRQIQLIFGNISDIYVMAKEFLESLNSAVSQCHSVHTALIGQCFLQHKEKFRIYSSYCNNHPRALEELQTLNGDKQYVHFFEACRLLQNMINLPLDGFLLTPIQKICKYPLQLGELLKYTSADHDDYQPLQEALAAMKSIAMLINERKRKLESMQKVAEWQSNVDDWQEDDLLATSSELIHSGELSKLSSAGRLVERHFFLFDHQLVQCKKELLKKSLIYKSRVSLDNHSVVPVEDGKVGGSGSYVKNGFELRDQTGATVLVLSAKSAAEKDKWLKYFKKEQDIVQQDKESGFTVTDSFMAVAKISPQSKARKPNKSNSLGRDVKLGFNGTDNGKDNNNKLPTKQKTSNGLIHKLKRAKITSS